MDVIKLLEYLQGIIESSSKIPVTGKAVINKKEILDIIDQIMNHLPDEFKKAQWISDEKERILVDAKRQAKIFEEETIDKIRRRVEKQDLVKEAQTRAEEIIASAQRDAKIMRLAAGLPMPDSSVDVILSRALLEHVPDVPAAIGHMARVLKPGGVALHLVPCRYSLFGLAARLLPFGPLVQLLHVVMPWTRGQVEFSVHYDHCYPEALEEEFRAAGFSDVKTWITWAQPGYFEAAYPVFLMHAFYEVVVRRLKLRKLAAYTVVRATR